MSLRPLLRNTALTRLLAAQLPADFADWLDFVAIATLLAFSWQVEPVVFALLAVAMGLPYVLVGPLVGVLVDRAPLKPVLIASNAGRALATAAMVLAPDWPALLALVFTRNAVDAFFTPAKQAAIQAITQPGERMQANGISHAINQASKIAAPALGGALLIFLAPAQIFLVSAAVSLLAAALLIGFHPPARAPGGGEAAKSLFAGIGEGWAEVAGKPALRGALALMALGYFAMFFYDTLIAPLTRDLGFDATGLGLALAAVGAGGVAGAVWFGLRAAAPRHAFLWIATGAALSGLVVGVGGLAEVTGTVIALPVFISIFAVAGLTSAMVVVPVRTIIQTETDPSRIARVTALSEAANTMALLISPFLGAFIAAISSTGMAFIVGGALLLANAVYALLLHRNTQS